MCAVHHRLTASRKVKTTVVHAGRAGYESYNRTWNEWGWYLMKNSPCAIVNLVMNKLYTFIIIK